jgi:NADH-quinone oxidoreductase subunit E
MSTQVANRVDQILETYAWEKGYLIQVLLDVQREYNWLPGEALKRINEKLRVSLSQIYRVASFYKAFSLKPRGEHIANVCMGTACYVRGGPRILEKAEQALGVKAGETTEDMKFTLETVNCLGCCALGPVIVVDGEAHGKLPLTKVEATLKAYD